MATRSSDRFSTVRTEGAILPADLLQRIAAGDSSLPGLTPASFHLIEGEKLNEASNRAWNRLQGAWASFHSAWEKLSLTDPAVGTTRDRWLLPLFQELGYGRLQPLKDAFALGDKYYPISHVWGYVPIHMVGYRMDLDKRAAGSPSSHSLVQEFLNRSEQHLWGFVSNGLHLRVLRDNIRLTRQAYVEFDLQAMFEGKVYADFALLWRLCHQSRVEVEKPQECWLEQWSKVAEQQGLRILDQLRDGVERAITALGRGFLACPANAGLRERLRAGNLEAQDYYRQLLRLVYRLLFLFVAEDRDLLFDPKSDDAARDRYRRFFSAARLRQQAERLRGTQHTDLYEVHSLVMARLGSATGCPELGLPALGSFLFLPEAVSDLEGCRLANADLLAAVRALALTSDRESVRAVDYRNLGSEELGSIYESLLELHPEFNVEAGTFELGSASGHERKTTGSYYTPTSLITCLLDSALDPVLDDAIRQANPEAALLNLKVCDPACGSGHFLIAAAHRIAKRLAFIRTGEEEPPPEAVRTAVRAVIGHCVYGVDVNPMAVELCKVALWMEALDPGKPLSFLEHRIQCGNSLLGATPALQAQGIPDEAFEPSEGDDKALCRAYKKQNKDERQGQSRLFDGLDEPWNRLGDLATAMQGLEQEADETMAGVQRKQERYKQLVQSSGYLFGRLWADSWCAAFMRRKDKSFDYPITERVFRRIEKNPHDLTPWMREEIQRLAGEHRFFHWHLAFPDVFRVPGRGEQPENPHTGWSGGFDAVLGNPPWVRQELLKPNKRLLQVFPSFKSTADSSVYFLDRAVQIVRRGGRVGLLTPNKWFRADYAEPLRKLLRERTRVQLVIDFGHAKKLFLDADTFPAAVVVEPSSRPVGDQEICRFVRAHDADRKEHDLDDLIQNRVVLVPHAQLRPDRWELEDPRLSQLLKRLLASGKRLAEYVGQAPLYGLKTGFNDAFYVSTETKSALVKEDPSCESLFKKLFRGRDIQRWQCGWDDQWHIMIPSSQNRNWTWSACEEEAEAEEVFLATFPSLHRHLKRYERQLRERADQGQFWWELRACDYYDLFDQEKLVSQSIVYHSQFAIDTQKAVLNNTAILLVSTDPYLLAVLNSRVMWWILSRVMAPRKDEGLYFDIDTLGNVAVPDAAEKLKAAVRTEVERLMFLQQSPTAGPSELLTIERRINALVEQAFALSEGERQLLVGSLPPRDPFVVLEEQLAEAVPAPEADVPQTQVGVAPRPTTVPAISDQLFPTTERDRLLCAAMLDLVKAEPALPATAYLEALLLLTRPEWCRKFLDGEDQTAFVTALAAAPQELVGAPGKGVSWRLVKDALHANRALVPAPQGEPTALLPGPRFPSVRSGYPALSGALISLAAKAGQALHMNQTEAGPQFAPIQQVRQELAALVAAEMAA